jgi:hypothetical protein
MKIFFFALLLSTNVLAVNTISGQHTTDEGKKVSLSGMEWRTLNTTAGLTRKYIESHSDGWRYATKTEAAILLDSLWGHAVADWDSSNYDGAKWFFKNLVNGALDDIDESPKDLDETYRLILFIYGKNGDCTKDPTLTCYGRIAIYDKAAFFSYDFGLGLTFGKRPTTTKNRDNFLHLMVRKLKK